MNGTGPESWGRRGSWPEAARKEPPMGWREEASLSCRPTAGRKPEGKGNGDASTDQIAGGKTNKPNPASRPINIHLTKELSLKRRFSGLRSRWAMFKE